MEKKAKGIEMITQLGNMETIAKMDNGIGFSIKPIEQQPVILVAEDYVEILGHRINEGFKSFEDFVMHLKHLSDLGEENKRLLERMNHLKVDMGNLKAYLVTKLEESKLESTYGGQGQFESIQERIYKDILEKMPKGD